MIRLVDLNEWNHRLQWFLCNDFFAMISLQWFDCKDFYCNDLIAMISFNDFIQWFDCNDFFAMISLMISFNDLIAMIWLQWFLCNDFIKWFHSMIWLQWFDCNDCNDFFAKKGIFLEGIFVHLRHGKKDVFQCKKHALTQLLTKLL
jgi:hypothetical protein